MAQTYAARAVPAAAHHVMITLSVDRNAALLRNLADQKLPFADGISALA